MTKLKKKFVECVSREVYRHIDVRQRISEISFSYTSRLAIEMARFLC